MMQARSFLLVLGLTIGPAFGQLRVGEPEKVGISRTALDRAVDLIESEVRERNLGAASILVARHQTIVLHRGFGRLSSQTGALPVTPDSIYQVASITKPVTAIALMMLVERGKLALTDSVSVHLPEFVGGERSKVRVRDLLTHTSGLPSMVPDNTELRRIQAPLSEWVERAYKLELLFPPGSEFRYQSMGLLLAAEIVERISGMPLRDFEEREIFKPLGMQNTVLGLGRLRISDTVQMPQSREPGSQGLATGSGGNSEYWRNMGHPWGGMHTTSKDLGILLQAFLDSGTYSGRRILSPATVNAMTTNQNLGLNSPWGLGWGLGRSIVWSDFGDLVSPAAFGHSGATGCVAWADPETRLICVILTNRSSSADGGRMLRLVSNAVAASVEK